MSKGSLTVYLSLSLSLILSFVLTVIEGARISVIRMEAECVADIGMNSVLAEFHRELLEQYDLLFVDMSYGTTDCKAENTAEHLRRYMENNFIGTGKGKNAAKNWLSLSVDKSVIKEMSIASDDGGNVMKRQAIAYMQESSMEGMIAKIIGQVGELRTWGLETRDIARERENIQEQINAVAFLEEEDEEGNKKEISLDNPADRVNALRGSLVLNLVLGDMDHVSGTVIRPEDYISRRERLKGAGLRPGQRPPETVSDHILFDCYLFDKCGWYGNELEKSFMKYQIEYMIAGEKSDLENLEKVVKRLIRWREAANVIYLFSDAGKCAEAELLALTLTAVLQIPALVKLVKASILFAWAYMESLSDVKCLLKGGRIPLMKTAADWKTGLANIADFSGNIPDGENSGHGLSYQDYLRIMLFLENSERKNMRAMDIMEMDIRTTAGNVNFRMDACFDSYLSEISMSSAFGYHCDIQKRYGYD